MSTIDYSFDAAGVQYATATVSWGAVDLAEDELTRVTIERYEVHVSLDGGASFALATSVPGAQLSARLPRYPSGQTIKWCVRAVGSNGVGSDLSDPLDLVLTADTTPPVQPSTPTLSSKLGVLMVDWDGKDSAAAAQPPDYVATEVHYSTTTGFTPSDTTLAGTLSTAGRFMVGKLTVGTTYFVKLVSTDLAGNRSTASTQTSAVLAGVAGPDIEANSITANEIEAGAITGLVISGDVFKSSNGTGARWEASATGIRLYNSSNVKVVDLSTLTGQGSFTGTLATGAPTATQRVIVNPGGGTFFEKPNIAFFVDPSPAYTGGDFVWSASNQGTAPNDQNVMRIGTGNLSFGDTWTNTDPGAYLSITDDGELTITTRSKMLGTPATQFTGGNIFALQNSIRMTAEFIDLDNAPPADMGSARLDLNSSTLAGQLFPFATQAGAQLVADGKFDIQVADGWDDTVGGDAGFRVSTTRYGVSGASYLDLGSTYGDGMFHVFNSVSQTRLMMSGFGFNLDIPDAPINLNADDDQISLKGQSVMIGNPTTMLTTSANEVFLNAAAKLSLWGQSIDQKTSGSMALETTGGSATLDLKTAGSLRLWADGTQRFLVQDNGTYHFNRNYFRPAGGSSSSAYIESSADGELTITSSTVALTDTKLLVKNMVATTGTANLRYLSGADGRILPVSSWGANKLDQQEMSLDYRVFDLRPKSWVDRQLNEDHRGMWDYRQPGFVLEDVLGFNKDTSGTVELLIDRGPEGKIQGINYDRIGLYSWMAVRDLNERLARLEASQKN